MKTIQLKLKTIAYSKNGLQTINTYDDEKLDEYSEFNIGSITRFFTEVIILILQDKKLLNIDDLLDKYIPSNKQNDFSKTTIRDIIFDKSLLKNNIDKIPNKKFKTSKSIVDFLIEHKLFQKKAGHSDIGFIFLGRIIEIITKKTYIKACKKYIFDCLKICNTGIGNTNITLYNGNKKVNIHEIKHMYYASSAYGLYSCVHDLICFGKNIPKLLSKKGFQLLFNKLTLYDLHLSGFTFLALIYNKTKKLIDILIFVRTGLKFI